jgi:hypothetical protein
MTLTSSASGTGNGTVTYTVPSNPGASRSATLSVAGATTQVAQDGNPCTTAVGTITPTSANFGGAGGSGTIGLTFTASCPWTVQGVPAWVTITSGASGTGNGTVAYTVAANDGAARNATLTLAGRSFTLSQLAAGSAAPCDFVGSVSSVGSYSGSLASTDCKAGARGTSYNTDRYSFTASPGQQVAFFLSGGFDTYLYLRNPAGTVIASNDDGGGGTNSRIPASSGVFTLPAGSAGTYVIEVTSYSAGATGAYTLQRIQ